MEELESSEREEDGGDRSLMLEVDVIEWLCHEALEADSPLAVQGRVQEVHGALMRLDHNLHTYGRLYNRLQILAFLQDVCAHNPTANDGEDTQDDDEESLVEGDSYEEALSQYTSDQWKMLREQLILLKSLLLRRDADALVLPGVQDPCEDESLTKTGTPRPPRNFGIDGELSSLEIFHQDYQDVLCLLQMHATVAKFRESLQSLVSDSQRPQNSPYRAQNSKSQGVLLKKLEMTVDEYKNDLSEVLANDDSPTQHKLTSFLLHDLYSSHSQSDSTHRLPLRLYEDITQIMNQSVDEPHSYESLQVKVQELLKSWCNAVFTKPTLVRLGYGQPKRIHLPAEERISVSIFDEGTKELIERETQTESGAMMTQTTQTEGMKQPLMTQTATQTEQEATTATSTQTDSHQLMETRATQTEEPNMDTQAIQTEEQPMETHATQTEEPNMDKQAIQTEEQPMETHATQTEEPNMDTQAIGQHMESQETQTEEPTMDTQAIGTDGQPMESQETQTEEVDTQATQTDGQPMESQETQTDGAFLTQPPSPPADSQQTQQPQTEPSLSTTPSQGESVSLLPSQQTEQVTVGQDKQDVPQSESTNQREEEQRNDREDREEVDTAQKQAPVELAANERENGRAASSSETKRSSMDQNVRNGEKKRRKSTGSIHNKRRRKVIEWSSSDEDDDQSRGARRSYSPASSHAPAKGGRRRFTVQEKEAIRAGAKRFGVGAWKEIKDYYDDVLKSRTTVNIKDCYRTMLKKGEVS